MFSEGFQHRRRGDRMKNHFELFMRDQMTLSKRLIMRYRQLGLDETELIVILQLLRFQSDGIMFPTPSEMARYTSFDEQVVSRSLRQMMQKNLMTIEEINNGEGIVDEYYSFELIFNTLYTKEEPKRTTPTDQSVEVFKQFEREFGRVLSPIEIETINIWLDEDHYDVTLIQQALREAVLLSKLNFKYIDRILQEWQKKGVKSVDQAKQAGKKYHQHQTTPDKAPREKVDPAIYYNWLDDAED